MATVKPRREWQGFLLSHLRTARSLPVDREIRWMKIITKYWGWISFVLEFRHVFVSVPRISALYFSFRAWLKQKNLVSGLVPFLLLPSLRCCLHCRSAQSVSRPAVWAVEEKRVRGLNLCCWWLSTPVSNCCMSRLTPEIASVLFHALGTRQTFMPASTWYRVKRPLSGSKTLHRLPQTLPQHLISYAWIWLRHAVANQARLSRRTFRPYLTQGWSFNLSFLRFLSDGGRWKENCGMFRREDLNMDRGN